MIFRWTRLAALTLIVAAFPLLLCQCKAQKPALERSIFEEHRYIGHAMGAVGNTVLSNSLEAFKTNYKKGRRVFEVDFTLTGDRHIVAFHENPAFGMRAPVQMMTHKEFTSMRYMGKYTPLDISGVLSLMEEHPDVYLVTDTKYSFALIEHMLSELQRDRPGLLGRVVPQIYFPGDYEMARRFGLREMIYTLYKDNGRSDRDVVAFVRERPDITVVTMSTARFNPTLAASLKALGRRVFVHTVNGEDRIREFMGQGADGFYTDRYFP